MCPAKRDVQRSALLVGARARRHPTTTPDRMTRKQASPGNDRHGGDASSDRLFAGPGEARALARGIDWGATSLGASAGWPAAMRSAIALMLDLPFACCVWCGPDRVMIYNDSYSRVLGTKHPAAFGRTGAEVMPEAWATLSAEMAQVVARATPFFVEDAGFVLERDGGSGGADGWFTYAFSPVRDEGEGGDGGEVVALFNVGVETTRRVRAERALRGLLEGAPAVMAVYSGSDLLITYVNPMWERVVGKPNALNRTFREVFPEMADTGLLERLDAVQATGEPFEVRELELPLRRTPDGPVEPSYWNFVAQRQDIDVAALNGGVTPVRDEARHDVLVHAIDVTEQVRARRAAEAARDEAERARVGAEAAGRLKSEFLATMSHEFRTPLNAILGYAQLLDMGVLGPATPAQHAHLERLQASGRHLLQLVEDVLDVAKVEADRLAVRADVLATGPAIASALALVQPQATAKGIRILDHGVGGTGAPYQGDEHRVRQVLVNLLANAVKFTPPGGTITITCGAAREPQPGIQPGGAGSTPKLRDAPGWAWLRIQDTGPGIADELQGRLFEPFAQGDGALTRAHGGTGLGLAISRRLARLMGGDLVAEGRPGTGATFTLWLPAPAASPAGAHSHPPRREAAAAFAASGDEPAPAESLDPAAYAVLHALGTRLAAEAEAVAERYVAALRADGRFPGARDLPTVQLRDHATPVVGLLATQLMVIGETHGAAPELLADGGVVQRVMAELHGVQRHRLGWSEGDIEREMPFLIREVQAALDAAVDGATTVRVLDAMMPSTAVGMSIPSSAVLHAARYAADVARFILDKSARTTLRSYRFAVASSG
jgi:signal transduction histidine kinase